MRCGLKVGLLNQNVYLEGAIESDYAMVINDPNYFLIYINIQSAKFLSLIAYLCGVSFGAEIAYYCLFHNIEMAS